VCIRIQELGRSAVSEERMLAVTYRPKVVASVNVREGLTATLTDFAEKIQNGFRNPQMPGCLDGYWRISRNGR
jgi:hypothetical protein